MNYIPDRNTKKAYTVSFILLFSGVCAMMCASLSSRPAIPQFIGVAVCALGIFVMYRYALVYYVYTLDEEDFAVTRVSGRRNLTVCRLRYADISYACEEGKEQGKCRAVSRSFDYGVQPWRRKKYCIYVADGGKFMRLKIECSGEFFALLKNKLAPDAQEEE